jgi:alpha/beta superfamily hydrolase
MDERVIQIGRPVPLTGIWGQPQSLDSTTADAPKKVAVLLLNSGVMHHIGTCRLSVKLARRINSVNQLPTFRFDFSGIGDSEARRLNGFSLDAQAVEEVREVMDYLGDQFGIEAFILYGLCSGGHISYQAAEDDERVIAIGQIDGHCYPTIRAWVNHFKPRLFSIQVWTNKIKQLWQRIKTGRLAQNGAQIAGIDELYFEVPDFGALPRKQVITRRIKKLAAQQVKLLCIFTGNEPAYNYENQYRDCFHSVDFKDQLTLRHYPGASHIIAEPDYQERVIDDLVDWIDGVTAGHSTSN